jgi:hypothetical protein
MRNDMSNSMDSRQESEMHDSDAITQLALQPISLRASCPAMCWHLRRRSGG